MNQPEIDPQVQQAYQQLKATSRQTGPTPDADRLLKHYARTSPNRSAWVWPASLAASALLCVSLLYPLSRLLTPDPLPPLAAEPAQAPGPALPDQSDALTTAGQPPAAEPGFRPWVALDTPEDWWRQLRLHAEEADREGFLATWRAYQEFQQGVPLPDDLRQWIVANRLPEPPPG